MEHKRHEFLYRLKLDPKDQINDKEKEKIVEDALTCSEGLVKALEGIVNVLRRKDEGSVDSVISDIENYIVPALKNKEIREV